MHELAGSYRSVIVPKSGCPVTGQTEVNSSFTCSIKNGVLVGVSNVSSKLTSGIHLFYIGV